MAELTTPLLIRLLEFAREKAPDDLTLHKLADRIEQQGDTPLDSDAFPSLVPDGISADAGMAMDPPVSEKQRKAMWAAAEGRSTLGIPQSVGKEFVGKDAAPNAKATAAGAILLNPDKQALFLKRGADADHPGTWSWPGGGVEDEDDSLAHTAAREIEEETGAAIDPGKLRGLERRTSPDGIDFATFVADVDARDPKLNAENVEHAWAPLNKPPQPLHPGVAATLAKINQDASRAALSARIAREIDRGHKPDQAVAIAYSELGEDALPKALAMDWAANVESALTEAQRAMCGVADRCGIAFDRSTVRSYDQDGRLRVTTANISKAAVNPYLGREIPDWQELGLDPDKTYMLLRDPDELKKAAPTFSGLPIMIQHVPVNAEDHHPHLVVGATGSRPSFEAPFLTNDLVVWRKEGIDGIESDERKELSAAYHYKPDMTPGTYQGQRYDGVMRDIRGNHVALVKEGRAGSDVVVGDSLEAITMSKTLVSAKAAITMGALLMYLKPKLAQDQQIDLAPILKDVTAKNFAERKAGIAEALKTATAGKLAADANLQDLTGMLDTLEKVPADAEMETDPNAAMPGMGAEPEDNPATDADVVEAIKAFLANKLSEEDMAALNELIAGNDQGTGAGAGDADPEDPDKDKDKDMVSKAAMDEALKRISDTVPKRAVQLANEIRTAERECEPFTGKLTVAFDSAEAVYLHTLKTLGQDGLDDMPLEALKRILKAQPKPDDGKRRTTRVAQDAKTGAAESFYDRFPGAKRIGHAA